MGWNLLKGLKNVGNILDTEGWDTHPELFLIDWGERATEDCLINPTEFALL